INTAPGMVMGTAAYMSPEQARGEEVDARADIWSLGCVLYEMLTGRVPFEGTTTSHVIVNILEKEPQWTLASAVGAPAELEWIVRKALRKDRDERYQTAKELFGDLRSLKQRIEFQAELERSQSPEANVSHPGAGGKKEFATGSVKATAETGEVYPSPLTETKTLAGKLKSNKRAMALTLGALVLIAGVITYRFFIRREPTEISSAQSSSEKMTELKTVQVTTSSGLDMNPSFSPDGNSIAYSSDHGGSFEIYVKQLAEGGREIQLTSDGGQNLEPAWSPDGKLIAYQAKHRGIWVVPALGGTARQITDFGSRPAWSRDGAWIAFQSKDNQDFGATSPRITLSSTIWVVAAQGGEPKQITQAGSPAGGHGMPAWSPDGKRIMFVALVRLGEIWSVSAQGDDLKRLLSAPYTWIYDPIYSPDGKSIYYSALTEGLNFGLWQLRLSPDGEALGEPVKIQNSGLSNDRNLAISADGKRIAYSSVTTSSNIWSLPVSPSSSEARGAPVPLTSGTLLRNSGPSFSPDGR
ncbi:MAG: DPP IV N-terminal domain-containing protein, partial [Acidobacteriota bacterium]|nr:DPP IV N-terminal domain-containing protein [Acidobacteriota bacterium]